MQAQPARCTARALEGPLPRAVLLPGRQQLTRAPWLAGDSYLQHIAQSTGVTLSLHGIGSITDETYNPTV